MYQGRTLVELSQELERQLKTRKDYLAPTNMLVAEKTEENKIQISGLNGHALQLTDFAHDQVADALSIPRKYYQLMQEQAPELLTYNINAWFHKKPKQRLVRTLDGNIRAFLSSSYRTLDNYDLASVAVPILLEKSAKIESAELTDKRLYIKAILPSVQREITTSKLKGDIVSAGIVISNSEIGAGSVRVEPMIYRLVCTNGMIAPDSALRKYHVGKGADSDGVRELLTDESKIADDKAFWLKVRDIIKGSFDKDIFEMLVNRIEVAASNKIESPNLTKVIEVTAKKYALGDGLQEMLLTNLIRENDLSQWGLVNSITRTSQDSKNYEQATDLERIGGKVLELDRSEWREISEAA